MVALPATCYTLLAEDLYGMALIHHQEGMQTHGTDGS